MLNHIAYLKYLLRHKYFVFKACLRYKVPLLNAIFHDWHKFLPVEWTPYVENFYNKDGSRREGERDWEVFNQAWNHHQKMAKHHWQYWVLREDSGITLALKMQEKYAREMVADWWGAGMAITGKENLTSWYENNKEIIQLHPETREFVESLIYGNNTVLKTETEADRIPTSGDGGISRLITNAIWKYQS